MFIIYLFSDIILIFSIALVFNPEKSGNICLNVSFLDVASSCFLSLVPCLKFTNLLSLPCLSLQQVLKSQYEKSVRSLSCFIISYFILSYPTPSPIYIQITFNKHLSVRTRVEDSFDPEGCSLIIQKYTLNKISN